jgi:hypothetical protein
MRSDLDCEKMQARLVDDADHASKEQENLRSAFLDDRKQAKKPAQGGEDRHKNDAGNERDEKSEQKGHRPGSRKMRRARL